MKFVPIEGESPVCGWEPAVYDTLSQSRFAWDSDSTPVSKPEVHVERVATLVLQLLQLIVANDDNYALAA
jgi:hypothetical protein